MNKSLPDILREKGTSEWHMAHTNPVIEDLLAQWQQIQTAKSEEITQFMNKIQEKYDAQLAAWHAEYNMCMIMYLPQEPPVT